VSLLQGIKVLDLSRILAGPWATQLLADYGATVWKIEHPEGGDDTRRWGPPFVEIDGQSVAAYFMAANRGKCSIAVDISEAEGQRLVNELAKQADVLVENFKVGGLARYGLDFASLNQLNPQLIYCSITGFGQAGPAAHEAGYDAMMQATGGLMSITGQADATGGEPTKVGVAVTDLMTGLYAANAILAALHYRERHGVGQHIDLALFDTQLAMLANQGMNYLISGESPLRLGNAHPNIVPYQTFACRDKHIMLAVGNDKQFQRLCELIELPHLAENPDYATNAARVANRTTLIGKLQAVFPQHPSTHWLTLLQAAHIPAGPVNSIAEAFEHPQAKFREVVGQFHCRDQTLPFIAHPAKFSAVELDYQPPPMKVGQHNDKIDEWLKTSTVNAIES